VPKRHAKITLGIVLSVAPGACGGATTEPDPLAFLQVGVDPATEAETIAADLRRAGFDEIVRRDETSFVVILAHRPRDHAARLRLVTTRGTAFAVDVPDTRDPERLGLRLPEHPIADLDGDRRPELLVAIERPGRTCLGVVRITDEGVALEVPLPLLRVGPNACVERIDDVAGDARAELVAIARLEIPGLDAPATFARPIVGREGTFILLDPPDSERLHRAERTRLEVALAQANEGSTRVRLALELAWLAIAEGAEEADAVAAFERDAGMPDDPTTARAREALRSLARPPSE
jgi:hypothetical protein